jgi:hypothetical protein
MSTHPTDKEIAKEAAEKFEKYIRSLAIGPTDGKLPSEIILIAASRIAAQMVRDSGAVEALEALQNQPRYPFNPGIIDAALAKLRAITEHP